MEYLCMKQLTAGRVTYHPGEIIPDGVILPKRSGKLLKSGYLSEFSEEIGYDGTFVAKLEETKLGVYDGIVQIAIKEEFHGEKEPILVIPARTEEIQQVFSIMQLNAEEGARVIDDVKSENVLLLLHAADSRKMIKNAAKEQVNKLFFLREDLTESNKNDETIGTNTEEVDA